MGERTRAGEPGKGLQVDGIFGPQTDTAVRGFKQALQITVDGIVGPVTCVPATTDGKPPSNHEDHDLRLEY